MNQPPPATEGPDEPGAEYDSEILAAFLDRMAAQQAEMNAEIWAAHLERLAGTWGPKAKAEAEAGTDLWPEPSPEAGQ